MLLVNGDAVHAIVACVCDGADLLTYLHAATHADYPDSNAVGGAFADRGVDVAWVEGEEGAEDDDHFSCAVGGGVE